MGEMILQVFHINNNKYVSTSILHLDENKYERYKKNYVATYKYYIYSNHMKATIAMREWSKLSSGGKQILAKTLKIKASPYSMFAQLPIKSRIALIKHFNK